MFYTVYSKGLLPTDGGRAVTRIVVSASGTINTLSTDEQGVFHWRLYLVLAPDQSRASTSQSVLFDMVPTNPPVGTLIAASNPAPTSGARVKAELPFETMGGPTVGQLIELFLHKGMDRYKFDDSGSGCVYWVLMGLQHLQDAGLVESQAVESLRAFHDEQSRLSPANHQVPFRRGTFY
ncbi:hypothetical protein BC834DRAFT_406837 [Gloeopeniophorella convolvens]|nr:hypothetical protein BC834DRAFT_406837 [Gloeopeniophorella convolvens]